MNQTQESNQSLWLVTASPIIWAAHFLLCYITASLWCAKVVGLGGSLTTVRVAIVAYAVVALIGIGIIGWIGYRTHSDGATEPLQDDDTPEDRHHFLGFAALLLSAVSAVAVIYATLVAVFVENCY